MGDLNTLEEKNDTEEMVETQFIRPEACVTQALPAVPHPVHTHWPCSCFPLERSDLQGISRNQEFPKIP